MFPEDIERLAQQIVASSKERGLMVSTAESCTGGLVAAAITSIAGSSLALDRGFVTYSNAAKTAMLGVPQTVLETHGAVSAPTAAAMAIGALERSAARASVSVTGVAGPGGGSRDKPVGLVHFAAVGPTGLLEHVERFGPLDRNTIRLASVRTALRLLADRISE